MGIFLVKVNPSMDMLDLIWVEGTIDGAYQHYRLPPEHYGLTVLTRRQYETVCKGSRPLGPTHHANGKAYKLA